MKKGKKCRAFDIENLPSPSEWSHFHCHQHACLFMVPSACLCLCYACLFRSKAVMKLVVLIYWKRSSSKKFSSWFSIRNKASLQLLWNWNWIASDRTEICFTIFWGPIFLFSFESFPSNVSTIKDQRKARRGMKVCQNLLTLFNTQCEGQKLCCC